MVIYILSIIFLLCCSFYFSGSETALFSIDIHKLALYKDSNDKRKQLIYKLLSSPNKLMITLLIGNISVNVLASTIFESLTRELSESIFKNNPLILKFVLPVSIIIMTFLLLICGEITPKTIAVSINEKFAYYSVPLLSKFFIIVTPIRMILLTLLNLIRKIMRIKSSPELLFKEEDIKTAIEMSHKDGEIDKDEIYLFKNIFEFEKYLVKDILIPKKNVFILDEEKTLSDLLNVLAKKNFTRILVYKDNIENISGIVYLNEIKSYEKMDKKLKELKKEIIYVPEIMNLSNLLIKLIKNNMDTAVVVDEYGSFIGYVSINEILEKIFGRINVDAENRNYINKINENEYIIKGFCDLTFINNYFNTNFQDNFSSSLNGFLTYKFGRIPKPNEKIIINKFEFLIIDSNNKYINEVKVRKIK